MYTITLEYTDRKGWNTDEEVTAFWVCVDDVPTSIGIIPETIIDLHRAHNINTSKEIVELMTNCFGSEITDKERELFELSATGILDRFIQNHIRMTHT